VLVSLEEAVPYCEQHLRKKVTARDLLSLAKEHFLPVYHAGGTMCFLAADLRLVVSACKLRRSVNRTLKQGMLFGGLDTNRLHLGSHTSVDLPEQGINPAYFSGVHSLMNVAATSRRLRADVGETDIGYFPPARVTTSCKRVREICSEQLARAEAVASGRASEFANSAYYMGSKRAITPFIIEALSGLVTANGVVVDLMCGSGSVAGACARFWPVIASDAQSFSRHLAVVQGGGFSRAEAASTLEFVLGTARRNAAELVQRIGDFIKVEDDLFHRDLDESLRRDYANFVAGFPLHRLNRSDHAWQPDCEVARRITNPHEMPYLLFSTYFANIYFGLRQAVEIDSLRFGIDQLGQGVAREWAIGALIATASRVATTYGGHFAEPLVRDWKALSLKLLSKIIEARTASVFHEFGVRLMNLADESERIPHRVKTLIGPWRRALQELQRVPGSESALIYLDPPYRREEYSRYYHALETLVTYTYPAVHGRGRLPEKLDSERFRSEFFTRSAARKLEALSAVISEIIKGGWTCVWNYSDAADVSIPSVLERVLAICPASVSSVSAPHTHQAQRGRGRKPVTEYLLIVAPRSRSASK